MLIKPLTIVALITFSSMSNAQLWKRSKDKEVIRPKGPFAEYAMPGSEYCESVKVIEINNYIEHKKNVDKHMAPIVNDMKNFLKTITSVERAIMKVEGSGSERLIGLDKRFKEIHKKYNASSQLAVKHLTKTISMERKVTGFSKYRKWEIENVHQKSGEIWKLSVYLSNPEEENNDIEASIKNYYLANSLEDYLHQKVEASCYEEKDSNINSDERQFRKDIDNNKSDDEVNKPSSSKQ